MRGRRKGDVGRRISGSPPPGAAVSFELPGSLLVCNHPGMAETRVALSAAARVGEGPVWDPTREGPCLAPGEGALDGSLFAVTATGATGLASAPFAGSA
jgi:hypothetical protein